MELRRVFAENLRQLRVGRGLSQEALADAAGIDRTYVSLLERRKYSPSLDLMERLADALGVAPEELITRSLNNPAGADAH